MRLVANAVHEFHRVRRRGWRVPSAARCRSWMRSASSPSWASSSRTTGGQALRPGLRTASVGQPGRPILLRPLRASDYRNPDRRAANLASGNGRADCSSFGSSRSGDFCATTSSSSFSSPSASKQMWRGVFTYTTNIYSVTISSGRPLYPERRRRQHSRRRPNTGYEILL